MHFDKSEGDVHHGCEDCLYALLEPAALGLGALSQLSLQCVMVPIVIILSSFVISFPKVFEWRDGPARGGDGFFRHDSGYICMRKTILVVIPVWDAAPFAAPGYDYQPAQNGKRLPIWELGKLRQPGGMSGKGEIMGL